MFRRVLLLAAAFSILFATDGHAKRRYKVEITPFGGYAFGGSFSDGSYVGDDAIDFRNLDIKSGGTLGIDLGIPVSRTVLLLASYSKQQTSLNLEQLTTNAIPLFDLSLNYWQFGFAYQYPQEGWVPYATLTFGVNYFVPKNDLSNLTRFATGLGLGVKRQLTDNLGVRGQIRGLGTYITSSDQFFCDSITGFCYRYPNSTWMWQGELTAGLIIAF